MDDEQEVFRGPRVCRLTGITYRQLDYWANTGVVEPSIEPARGSGSARFYSFTDVLCIEIMARLLKARVGFEFGAFAIKRFRSEKEEPRTLNFVFEGIEVTIWVTRVKNDLRKKIEATKSQQERLEKIS